MIKVKIINMRTLQHPTVNHAMTTSTSIIINKFLNIFLNALNTNSIDTAVR